MDEKSSSEESNVDYKIEDVALRLKVTVGQLRNAPSQAIEENLDNFPSDHIMYLWLVLWTSSSPDFQWKDTWESESSISSALVNRVNVSIGTRCTYPIEGNMPYHEQLRSLCGYPGREYGEYEKEWVNPDAMDEEEGEEEEDKEDVIIYGDSSSDQEGDVKLNAEEHNLWEAMNQNGSLDPLSAVSDGDDKEQLQNAPTAPQFVKQTTLSLEAKLLDDVNNLLDGVQRTHFTFQLQKHGPNLWSVIAVGRQCETRVTFSRNQFSLSMDSIDNMGGNRLANLNWHIQGCKVATEPSLLPTRLCSSDFQGELNLTDERARKWAQGPLYLCLLQHEELSRAEANRTVATMTKLFPIWRQQASLICVNTYYKNSQDFVILSFRESTERLSMEQLLGRVASLWNNLKYDLVVVASPLRPQTTTAPLIASRSSQVGFLKPSLPRLNRLPKTEVRSLTKVDREMLAVVRFFNVLSRAVSDENTRMQLLHFINEDLNKRRLIELAALTQQEEYLQLQEQLAELPASLEFVVALKESNILLTDWCGSAIERLVKIGIDSGRAAMLEQTARFFSDNPVNEDRLNAAIVTASLMEDGPMRLGNLTNLVYLQDIMGQCEMPSYAGIIIQGIGFNFHGSSFQIAVHDKVGWKAPNIFPSTPYMDTVLALWLMRYFALQESHIWPKIQTAISRKAGFAGLPAILVQSNKRNNKLFMLKSENIFEQLHAELTVGDNATLRIGWPPFIRTIRDLRRLLCMAISALAQGNVMVQDALGHMARHGEAIAQQYYQLNEAAQMAEHSKRVVGGLLGFGDEAFPPSPNTLL